MALVVSIALGVVAFFQRQEAVAQRTEAIKQSQISLARQLAAQAQSVKLTGSEQVAALLDIRSLKIYPTGDAANFLIDNAFPRPVANMKHTSYALSVTFSPDGKYAATGMVDGTVRIWEVSTSKEVSNFTQAEYILNISFSRDGKYIVSLGGDGNAYIWEVATGNEVSSISDSINAVSFSSNGKDIISAGCEKLDEVNASCTQYSFSIWEAATGKKLKSIPYDTQGDESRNVAFSLDTKYMVSAGDRYLDIWEINSGRKIARILHTIDGGVRSLAFSPGGEYVVTGGNDGTVRVWEIATGREVARMTMSLGDPVASVVFSPDRKYVAAGSGEWSKSPLGSIDHTIRIWNAFTGVEVTRITQNSWVTSIAFSPDGKFIVSNECDKQDENFDCVQSSARVWEIRTDVERMIQEGGLSSAVFSSDGKYVASQSNDIQVWEPSTGRQVANFKNEQYTSSFAFSQDGKYIVTAGCDKYDADYICLQHSARVWEFAKGKEVSSMVHKGYVRFLAFSSDGENIISTDDHTVVIWQAYTGKEISRTVDEDNNIIAISSNGKYVVSSRCDKVDAVYICIEGFTRIWKTETGEDIVRLTDSTSIATFSPDGEYVILTNCIKHNILQNCTQSTLDELEIATGKEIIHVTHEGDVKSVAFSPDGKHAISEGSDGTARVWETATGKEIAHITHTSVVGNFALSPDGQYVISAFEDGSARVWELVTGKEIAYAKHVGSVSTVAFSPDGKYVVSGGCIEGDMVGCTKSSVRVWLWQPKDLIADTCSFMLRNLTRAEWAQYIGDAMPYQAVCENLPLEPEVTATPTVAATP